MPNAVIYARYSSSNQHEQSIEGQLHDNYDWAARNGITVIGEYIDRALSGTTDDRPDFLRMIRDAEKRQFEMVIVWKLDRFSRNRYDSAIYKHKLRECGVRVVSAKEEISDTPEGVILEGLLESMAEYYSRNLSQNVRRGLRESALKGYYLSSIPLLGYKKEDRHLVIDERTAPLVREVFSRYASGESKKSIMDDLNARGLRTPRGKPFSKNSFQATLTNRAYIGEYTFGGRLIPGAVPPLIDREIFDRVQEKIKLNARNKASGKAVIKYELTGKCFCGLCGSPMIGDSGYSRTGAQHAYYTCAARKHKRPAPCPKKSEKKDFIEWYAVEQTMQYVLSPNRINAVAAAVVAAYKKEFSSSRLEELKKQIASLDRELDKLIDTMMDTPKAARARISERMESVSAQKTEAETELSKLRIAAGIEITAPEVRAWLRQYLKGDPLDPAFRSRVLDTFINSVYLWDNRIVIFYNIRGGKQVSYIDAISASENPEPLEKQNRQPGSDTDGHSGVEHAISEPGYIFVHGTMGIVAPINR